MTGFDNINEELSKDTKPFTNVTPKHGFVKTMQIGVVRLIKYLSKQNKEWWVNVMITGVVIMFLVTLLKVVIGWLI